jgi:hypothetical protein
MSEVYALGGVGAHTQATVKMSMGRIILQYMQIKNALMRKIHAGRRAGT